MDVLKSIESQTVTLTPIDTQGSFANIPFVFFYKNQSGDAKFMESNLLREAFYHTIVQVPTLAGRVKTRGRGQVRVVVDNQNLNLPAYKESLSNIHFDDLEAEGFCWRSWPDGVNTAGPVTRAGDSGDIKLANVHVIRLCKGSGVMIYISMAHYIVDCPGYVAIVQRWCEIHRLLTSGNLEKVHGLPPISINRKEAWSRLPKEREPVDKETTGIYTGFSLFAECFAWFSPKLRGYIASKVAERQNAKTHVFHITRADLESLRSSIGGLVDNVSDVADTDLIMALSTRAIARAQETIRQRSRKHRFFQTIRCRKQIMPLITVFEVRDRLGLEHTDYAGNMLIPKIATKDASRLHTPTTTETLANTVVDLGLVTKDISPAYIASHVDMVMPRPSSFARPIARFIGNRNALTYVYDQSPYMYGADFGTGNPEWVSPIEPFRVNLVQLLACKDPLEGVDVFMSVYPKVMEQVLKNESWTSVAKLLY